MIKFNKDKARKNYGKDTNETNIVLQDIGTFYWQISAFKCNFGPICGL